MCARLIEGQTFGYLFNRYWHVTPVALIQRTVGIGCYMNLINMGSVIN
jgi:hypothetical protein